MKQAFSGLKPVYQIVILDLLGGILISAVLKSDILTNSKISLSVIIGIVVGLLIIAIYQKSARQQQELLMEQMDARFEQYFIRIKELADRSDAEIAEHCRELEEKIKVLENNIAAFPLAIALGYTVYSVIRKGLKPFYDSDWIISGEHNGQLYACHITRKDTETTRDLIELVKSTASPDDIWALDEYSEIYPEENAA